MTAGISDLSSEELEAVSKEATELHMRYLRHRRVTGSLFVSFTWGGVILERRLDLPALTWDPVYRRFTTVVET